MHEDNKVGAREVTVYDVFDLCLEVNLPVYRGVPTCTRESLSHELPLCILACMLGRQGQNKQFLFIPNSAKGMAGGGGRPL